VSKVQHKPIKRLKLGFKRKEQKKPKRILVWRTDCPMCHRIVSGAPGAINSNLPPSGFWKSHSSIIHQTVRCANGATAPKRNSRLKSEQLAQSQSSARRRTGLSGAPRCLSSNGRNRQNPNGWVTWLAHRTMSGGAPDPSTAALPNSKPPIKSKSIIQL
jgi:hypothetical protein